jgi:methionyl-tRNA synthetase
MDFRKHTDTRAMLDALPRGMPVSVPPQLFSKIEDAQVAEWTQKFGGGESS